MSDGLPQVTLRNGERVPAFGQGTWHMGDDRRRAAEEMAALKLGIDLGLTLIDTAEMYGSGAAEEVVAEAAQGQRDRLFIVSKVLPYNSSQKGVIEACERSLRRLKTDRIDLYLLHWRGSVPLADTLAGFARLQRDGKIRHHGVSNLDLDDVQELGSVPGGKGVATDQLLYNLARRGIEWDLLPWLRKRHIPVMAYSPIERASLARKPKLADFARRHGMTPAQAALAWLLAKDDIIAIPKTAHRERLKENAGALELTLSSEQLAKLDNLFPPPKGPRPLEML